MVALLGLSLLQAKDVTPPIEDSIGLYREWNAKVAKAQRVEIDVLPPSNGEMHDVRYYFQRPNVGGAHGMNYGFEGDGRRVRSDSTAFGTFNRPARPDDLKKYLNLPGFESFFAPRAKVEGLGPLRLVHPYVEYGKEFPALAADLRIDGRKLTLYFNPISRVPMAHGPLRTRDLSYDSMSDWYVSIKLSPTRQKVAPVLPEE